MELLNNREIAILFWLTVLLIWSCLKNEIRKSLKLVLKYALHKTILTFTFVFYVYVILIAWCLSGFDLWDSSQAKNTLIWSILVGMVAIFKVAENTKQTTFFKNWMFGHIKIIIIIEFIVSSYTFPLTIELILQPILLLVGMMGAYSEKKKEYKAVSNLCNGMLVIAGISIVAYALRGVWIDYDDFATIQTLRDFYTPIVLSLALTPFLYALYVYSSYERVFSVLRLVTDNKGLRAYMRLKAVFAFGGDIEFLDRWRRKILLDPPEDKAGIRKSISEIKEIEAIEKDPPHVDLSKGWSPYTARKFLKTYGIITGDYYEAHGEWFAAAPLFELGEQVILKDNIGYYIDGTQCAAKRLKLQLNVNNPEDHRVSEEKFVQIAATLYESASSQSVPTEFCEIVSLGEGVLSINDRMKVSVFKNNWCGSVDGGYDKEVVFEII